MTSSCLAMRRLTIYCSKYSTLNYFKRFKSRLVNKKDPQYLENMPENRYAHENARRQIRLYAWGSAEYGSLGIPNFVKGQNKRLVRNINKPCRLNFATFHEVQDVACGNNFTVIAATNSDHHFKVFGTGLNTDSQIGYHSVLAGKPLVLLAAPVPIQIPLQSEKTKILRVACGRAHTVIVTDNEGVFSLGNNAFGQCGRPIVENEIYEESNIINHIKGIDGKVVDAVCGQDHTLFLTETGQVYSCGWGADGQTDFPRTGQGHYNSNGIPKKVMGDIEGERIIQLSGTVDCNLAVSAKGDLFGWGNSEYGQLSACTKEMQSNTSKHIPLPSVGKVVHSASGGTLCAVVNEKGLVYVWGYGILGQGPNVTALEKPTLLPPPLFGRNDLNPDVVVKQVACGLSCFAAISSKGDLYMWGKNKNNCLGLGEKQDQLFPFRVSVPAEVTKVSCGVDHTFVMCRSYV